MWRIDHYLTVDYDIVLQTFRRVSKHLEDSKKIGLSHSEEEFFFPGGSHRACCLLAFDAFLTVIFPDTEPEGEPGFWKAQLREELWSLSERARCPILSAVFSDAKAERSWLGACDGSSMAEGEWGVPDGEEPDFPLLASLLRLPGQEEPFRQAWTEKEPGRFLKAMEEAAGLPFSLPEELEGGYQKTEDRMAMKLYRPLAPALDRFFYLPQEEEKPPDTSGDLFSLLGRGSLHLYREGLEEQRFLQALQSENEAHRNKITVLVEHRCITIWKLSGAPFSPGETEKISSILHCGAISTLVCGERAFSLCAAYNGDRISAACWQNFSPNAWGIEQKCRMAWQVWLRDHPHSSGMKTQEAARLCGRFGISPEPFIEAIRFGNLPYLLEKLPDVMGMHFDIPGGLKSFPSETLPCGRLYWEPEKKGSNLWK